jgi:hypothetical protein
LRSEAKKFIIHRVPSTYGYARSQRTASRPRVPSDTSSIQTVTARTSPSSGRRVSRRIASGSSTVYEDNSRSNNEDSSQSRGPTSFLSRMWGAATSGKDKSLNGVVDIVEPEVYQGHSSALRRLVLVHSRSSMFRTTSSSALNV